jgi:hypothetical protein
LHRVEDRRSCPRIGDRRTGFRSYAQRAELETRGGDCAGLL